MNLSKRLAAAIFALGVSAVLPAADGSAQETTVPLSEATADELISALKPKGTGLTYRGVPERTQRGLSFEASETESSTGSGTAAAEPADLPAVSLNVPFAFDSADLTGDARRMLREVGKAMTSAELAPYRFLLEGHTDSVGPASYNKTLSQRRARAVREFLTAEMGVPENKLATRGHGERFLRDPQNPESAANRRVEIINIGS